MQTFETGIGPLDERVGPLRAGELYVFSAPLGEARTAVGLQVAARGLAGDEPVAMVTQRTPDQLWEQAEHWGFPLREAWQDARLELFGVRGAFEERLRRAADPGEVFDELDDLLGPPAPERIVFDPVTPIWENVTGAQMADSFLSWVNEREGTVWAMTLALPGGPDVTTHRVLDGAAGVFDMEADDPPLLRIHVRDLTPPVSNPGVITVALVASRGLVAPPDELGRRSDDLPSSARNRLMLLQLADNSSPELLSWLQARYEVTAVSDPMDFFHEVRQSDGSGYGFHVLLGTGDELETVRKAVRVTRDMSDAAVVVLLPDTVRASDRASLLQGGADEVLSRPVDVEELESRLRRLKARLWERSGGAELPEETDEGGECPEEESPPSPRLAAEEETARRIHEQLASSNPGVFTLVYCTGAGRDWSTVADEMARQVRGEEGDFVGPLGEGFVVYLHRTLPDQAELFLERVGEITDLALDSARQGDASVTLLGSRRDRDQIRQLVQ